MALFLVVLEGPTPAEAKTLLATGDPRLVQLFARELAIRLGRESPLVPSPARPSEQKR